ncbi:DNA-3-methyladenine glycosylase 2 family protein [bacterium]|nr:DNA-3-methyladenine glycosylase 2 family protein [bacterium]
MPTRSITAIAPVDLARSVGVQAAGSGDPTMAVAAGSVWAAMRTPDGPATVNITGEGLHLEAEAWGPGAEIALERAPGIAGALDDPTGFDPADPIVSRLYRRYPGIRITRSGEVFDLMVKSILGQRVTGKEAKASYRALATSLSEPAPGPRPLVVPPDPATLGAMAYHRFHPFGIERDRATTIIKVARSVGRIQETLTMSHDDAFERLIAFPGIGPWTAAIVGMAALGDPDAVPIGDYHLPNTIAWVMAGEPRATDERMLELLAPFAGHRARAVRLIKSAGVKAPKYGPRRQMRSITDI